MDGKSMDWANGEDGAGGHGVGCALAFMEKDDTEGREGLGLKKGPK